LYSCLFKNKPFIIFKSYFSLKNNGKNNTISKTKIASSKYLVNYGSNLGYSLDYGKLNNLTKSLIFLMPETFSVLVGILLSDGHLEKSYSNARFRFKQSLNRSDYVLSSFFSLSHYCSNKPYISKSIRNNKLN
jgi:hypothetical protein